MGSSRHIQVIIVMISMLCSGLLAFGGGSIFAPPTPYHNATLHVELTYPNGSPAVGFGISVGSYERSFSGIVLDTNSTGEATFSLTGFYWGPMYIHAMDRATSMLVDSDRLYIEPDGVYELKLIVNPPPPQDYIVHGTVTNRSTGLPLAGVEVQGYGYDIYGNQFMGSNITAMNGSYLLGLPWSRDVVTIYAYPLGYNEATNDFYMDPDEKDYRRDLVLYPRYYPGSKVEIRMVNETTDEPMVSGSIQISGLAPSLDHVTMEYYPNPNAEDYWEAEIAEGDYGLYYASGLPDMNITFEFYAGLIVEGSPVKKDIKVPVPEIAPLDFRIWNGTGPVTNMGVSYYSTTWGSQGPFTIQGHSTTDAQGFGRFGVPTDRAVRIQGQAYDYEEMEHTFDPLSHTEPFSINLTLVKKTPVTYPEGTINITVRDPVSGLNVPRAEIFMRGSSEGSWFAYFKTTNGTGQVKMTARAGHYDTVEVNSNLGWKAYGSLDIAEGANPDLIIDIERKVFPGSSLMCSLGVADPQGEPVGRLPVYIRNDFGAGETYSTLYTDDEGKLFLNIRPGTLTVWADAPPGGGINPYVFAPMTYEIEPGTSDLGTITAYPALPTAPYTGHLLNGSSSEPLSYVWLGTYSYHMTEGLPARSYLRNDPDIMQLSYLDSYSDPDGRWRGWGSDNVLLVFQRSGYFPKGIWTREGTRADLGDVDLEPLPAFDAHVSGWVVDGSDQRKSAYISVYDRDRDTPEYVGYTFVNETMDFDIPLYPGNFTFVYEYGDMNDWMDVSIPPGGLSGLKLVLRPNAELEGFVKLPSGGSAVGHSVRLIDTSTPIPTVIATDETNEVGFYEFKVYEGSYQVHVDRTELYDAYTSGTLVSDGENDLRKDIALMNRSQADVVGRLTGSGGPFATGIPFATVKLITQANETLAETMTDVSGSYHLSDIGHIEDIWIHAVPPLNLSGEVDARTGYLPEKKPIDISGYLVEQDMELEYYLLPPPEFVNITLYAPIGSGVPLDADIRVWFSVPVNMTSAIAAFTIGPSVDSLEFLFDTESTVMTVSHAPFELNTTYTATIAGSVLSTKGVGLWNASVLSWSFTTVAVAPPIEPPKGWELFSVQVFVDPKKNVSVQAQGAKNISVFLVIDGEGSFELSGSPYGNRSTYSVFIPGSAFDWNTTYEYHFSNISGGPDIAPAFAGTFKTPEEPEIPIGDDDDDDVSILEGIGTLGWCCIIAFAILLLLIIIVVVVLITRRKAEEEEEMSWGEE